ncbi:MAG: DNA methyltransferase, partial [bacterium]
ELYNELCTAEGIEKQKVVRGDCRTLLQHIQNTAVDFIVLDPPHPAGEKEWFEAEETGKPLSEAFMDFMGSILPQCHRVLKPGRHLALFARNFYSGGRYFLMSNRLESAAENAGFVLRGEKIWENPGERLRPFGYPHTYVPNVVHYNVLIFQKPAG